MADRYSVCSANLEDSRPVTGSVELAEENALPGAKGGGAVFDWDRHFGSDEGDLDVGIAVALVMAEATALRYEFA